MRSRSFAAAMAIVCALYLQALVQRARTDMLQWGTRSPAVVALHRIEPGHRIRSADITVRMLPTTLLPTGASTSANAMVGRIPTVPVVAGQILTPAVLADRDASPTALRIGRGRIGVTIDVGAARPTLSIGSLVLIIASPDAEARSGTASVEGTVVTFDDRFVTVSVPEHQAPTLATLLAGGPVYLALKGA